MFKRSLAPTFLKLLYFLAFSAATLSLNIFTRFVEAQSARPNIIIYLSDDLGWDDLGVYGNSTIQTPNLDQFAAQGMRFTNYYTAGAVCSPTRASILTGRYPLSFGLKRVIDGDDRAGLPKATMTLPRLLRQAGYNTLQVGKWHLGDSQPYFLPLAMGFSRSLRWSGSGDHTNYTLIENEKTTTNYQNGYMLHSLTDYLVNYINSYDSQKPFMIYFAPYAVHTPFVVPPNFDHRAFGYDTSQVLGRYQSMVSDLDQQFKRMLDALESKGISDNTLILFTSDNGTFKPVKSVQSAWRGGKSEMYEGGLKVPLLVKWPTTVAPNTLNSSVLFSNDIFATLALSAQVSVSGLVLQGESFLKVLKNNITKIRKGNLFWSISNALTLEDSKSSTDDDFAVRSGDFKLLKQDNQLGLFNLALDPSEASDIKDQHPETVEKLIKAVRSWRLSTSRIQYKAALSTSGVKSSKLSNQKQIYDFNSTLGRVRIEGSRINHVGDSDLSMSLSFRAKKVSGIYILAKNSAFVLQINSAKLELIVNPHTGEAVTLTSGPIKANKSYKVAFTVYAWRGGANTVRLYLNGNKVDESINQIDQLKSSNTALVLGGPLNGSKPTNSEKAKSFRGWMTQPKFWALSLNPDEL
jgi:arylsulfatase A